MMFVRIVPTLILVALVALAVNPAVQSVSIGPTRSEGQGAPKDGRWTDHAPISVNGNADLTSKAASQGWTGSGTSSDPITIKDYRIMANGPRCILISNTDLHLLIEVCNLTSSSQVAVQLLNCRNVNVSGNLVYNNQGDGIQLIDCSSCTVFENIFKGGEVVNNYNAIHLLSSFSNKITGNYATLGVNDGIRLEDGSRDNMVTDNYIVENNNNGISFESGPNTAIGNHVLSNRAGIKVSSANCLLKNNHLTANGYGIELSNASYSEIMNNILIYNFNGLNIKNSVFNEITDNYILKSSDYGINIDCNLGSENVLYGNVFFYNNDTTSHFVKGYVQARDARGDSIWCSPSARGNHWYDWRVPDNNGDDIIDKPYKLDGNGGSDLYPLLLSPIPDVFNPPYQFKATPGPNFINLTWKAPYFGPGVKPLFFRLYRSERGGGEFPIKDLDGRATFYVDKDVYKGRSYYYYITAWSFLGEGNRSIRVKSSPDTKAPSVDVTFPKDGSMLNLTSVKIEWTGKDDILVDRYEASLDGSVLIDVGLNTSLEFEGLNDGMHRFNVRIYDLAEHFMEDTVTFTIDTVVPTVEIIEGKDPVLYSSTRSPTIHWTGSDDRSGVKGYLVSSDGSSWKWIGNIESYTFSSLVDGDWNLSVKVEDLAGNHGSDMVASVIDTKAPEIAILSPKDGSFTESNEIAISWKGTDEGSGIFSYFTRIDSDRWTDVGTATDTVITADSGGGHIIEVKARDKAGNEAVGSVSVTVDRTPPVVKITSPRTGSYLNSPFFLEWDALDRESDIALYRIFLDGSLVREFQVEQAVEVSFREDGDHTIVLEVVDLAGNSASSQATFRYDLTNPGVRNAFPSGKNVPIDTVIALSFSEEMNISSVRIDGASLSGEYKWSDLGNMTLKPHTALEYSKTYSLRVYGKDLAGNDLIAFYWAFTTAYDPARELGFVLGRVVDVNATPISNATLKFRTGERGVTDANGSFYIGLTPGNNLLIVSKDGYLDSKVSFELKDDQVLDLGDIPMKPYTPSNETPPRKSYTWVIIIAAVVVLVVFIAVLVAYQVKKTRDYAKMPILEKDEWVNVHIGK